MKNFKINLFISVFLMFFNFINSNPILFDGWEDAKEEIKNNNDFIYKLIDHLNQDGSQKTLKNIEFSYKMKSEEFDNKFWLKVNLENKKCAAPGFCIITNENCEFIIKKKNNNIKVLYQICDDNKNDNNNNNNNNNNNKTEDFDFKPISSENDLLDINNLKNLEPREAFKLFKKHYNKNYYDNYNNNNYNKYKNLEEEKRFLIFKENMKIAAKKQEEDGGSAVFGATIYSDLTKEEFSERFLNKQLKKHALNKFKENDYNLVMKEDRELEDDSFDWRKSGAVSPIKNQGACGSCWAFSTTGNIESQWFLKTKKMNLLSEQQLVDCDNEDSGCNGGLMSNAFREIMRMGGLETESSYGYKARKGRCLFQDSKISVYINSSIVISQDENEMASWLKKNGPISIGLNAHDLQFYRKGISHPRYCPASGIDHAMLIVGYGIDKTKRPVLPYWIIKNSWGISWGDKGYYYLYRGDGSCGVNKMAVSSIIY